MGSVSCFVMFLADFLMKINSKTYELGKLFLHHVICSVAMSMHCTVGPLNLAHLCKPGHATEEAEGSAFFDLCWNKNEIIYTPDI